jgi:mono/diheme cytochrome c family protein
MISTNVLLSILFAFPSAADTPATVDYLRDVKPLLAKRCVTCHGETRPRGGLRLDTAALALKGGKNGPSVVPGKADDSPLIEAVVGDGGIERMPLKRSPLTPTEIETLRKWVNSGAKSPANEPPTQLNETHWSLSSPKRVTPPTVKDREWSKQPIDAFIAAKLESEHLTPSPEADRPTLIRRVTLDLIGLPPTPGEVDAFVQDKRPDAYDRLIDRLLASPHYGERWARPWLDLARYADSNGYSIDAPRSIWKYRDWVINAINKDLPVDQFIIDQLAGDLRPNATIDQQVATGFHRNTQINQEGGIDLEQFRVEAIADRVSTTSTAFLGLTMGCAECHDHKYDPLTQREYYSLFAFFNSCDEPELEFADAGAKAKREKVQQELIAAHVKLRKEHPEITQKMKEWEAALAPEFKVNLNPELKDAFDRDVEKRTESQWRGLTELFLAARPEYKNERKILQTLRSKEPKFETTLVVRERKQPRVTTVHLGGDFTRKGDVVKPGVPAVLPAIKGRSAEKLDRLDLANWLVDPNHPLTSRVTVNRVWQAFFGRGFVETENDFGTQGSLPTHPELLDWLATELIAKGWSMKALHREIVSSRTYRQSSKSRPELDKVDSGNRLLGRQSRLRVDAELIRDSALAASGLLSTTVGGPSVFPSQPDGVMTLGQMRRPWKMSEGADRFRRGLYTFFWRATPYPGLIAFDSPNAIQACTRRNRSNTPIQALTLLNDASFMECAAALAGRATGKDDQTRIDAMFKSTLGRPATVAEQKALVALLNDERADAKGKGEAGEKASWTTIARVLLNLDEFITRE